MMRYFDLYKGLIEDDVTHMKKEVSDEQMWAQYEERIHTCEKAICNVLDRVEAIEARHKENMEFLKRMEI